jgi:hypothetical protein
MMRHLILIPGIAASVVSCAATTGPADIEGVYQLVELNGESLPYDDQPYGCCIYTDGSLTIEPDRYEISVGFRNKNNGMVGTSTEFGTYSVNGRFMTFDWGGGDFHHHLYDAQIDGATITLYLGGDGPGAADQFRAMFRK